jgi:hypothetical protein
MVLDLDADLVPGVGAAGLTIGQPIKSLLEVAICIFGEGSNEDVADKT